MTNKGKFELWLKQKHSENSGAPSSYLRCIDILSESFYSNKKIDSESLYEIFDFDLLKSLHEETLRIQKDKNSFNQKT